MTGWLCTLDCHGLFRSKQALMKSEGCERRKKTPKKTTTPLCAITLNQIQYWMFWPYKKNSTLVEKEDRIMAWFFFLFQRFEKREKQRETADQAKGLRGVRTYTTRNRLLRTQTELGENIRKGRSVGRGGGRMAEKEVKLNFAEGYYYYFF